MTNTRTRQSSATGQSRNEITVRWKTSVPLRSTFSLQHTSMVTISGLLGSLTPSTMTLDIVGNDAHYFGGTALWDATLGHVVLRLAAGQKIERNSLVSVSFALANGAKINNGQHIYVSGILGLFEVDGRVIGVPKPIQSLRAAGGPILRTTLSAEWYIKAIGQDNEVNAAVNRIEITLAANIPLGEGFKITIAPLLSETPYTTIPLLGESTSHLASSAAYDAATGSLVITVVREIKADSQVVVSVRLRNRWCGMGCQTPSSLTVAGSGEALEPFLLIRPSPISNPFKVLRGGDILRWRSKNVRQSTAVMGALNLLTFSLRPSAPIFAPSTITIKGLRGTQARTCHPCALPSDPNIQDKLAGLGCSSKCAQEQLNVLALFEDSTAKSPHPLFQHGLGVWERENGTLIMQLAPDAVLSSETITSITIVLRNSGTPRAQRAECETILRETEQSCLTVVARAQLCETNLPAWNVGPCAADMRGIELSYKSTQAQPEAELTKDRCGTCMRHDDIVTLHDSIKDLQSLIIQPTDVMSPSIVLGGLPRAVDGVPAGGTYTVQLQVTNWMGKTAQSTYKFDTSSRDDMRPMVYIEGLRQRFMTSDRDLSLTAVGSSAWCYLGGKVGEVLQYAWSSRCVSGPCDLTPPFETLASSTNTRFLYLASGTLTPSCTFEFTCKTTQTSIQRSSVDYVRVHVLVQPIQAKISGVSDDGFASSTVTPFLSIDLSWDPEQATTGLHPAHGLRASWRVEEVEKQAYCLLADAPLPPAGKNLWDTCPPETRQERPGYIYHLPTSLSPVPTIGLNTTRMRESKSKAHIKVTLSLSRDISKLPPAILRFVNNSFPLNLCSRSLFLVY